MSALKSVAIVSALQVGNEIIHRYILDWCSNAHNVLQNLWKGIFLPLVVSVGASSLGNFIKVCQIDGGMLKMFPCTRTLIEFSVLHLKFTTKWIVLINVGRKANNSKSCFQWHITNRLYSFGQLPWCCKKLGSPLKWQSRLALKIFLRRRLPFNHLKVCRQKHFRFGSWS